MTIGLVSYRCKDKDISFNMSQIERALRDTAGKEYTKTDEHYQERTSYDKEQIIIVNYGENK